MAPPGARGENRVSSGGGALTRPRRPAGRRRREGGPIVVEWHGSEKSVLLACLAASLLLGAVALVMLVRAAVP